MSRKLSGRKLEKYSRSSSIVNTTTGLKLRSPLWQWPKIKVFLDALLVPVQNQKQQKAAFFSPLAAAARIEKLGPDEIDQLTSTFRYNSLKTKVV